MSVAHRQIIAQQILAVRAQCDAMMNTLAAMEEADGTPKLTPTITGPKPRTYFGAPKKESTDGTTEEGGEGTDGATDRKAG